MRAGGITSPASAAAESEEKNEGIASCGLLGANDEQSENIGQNEAPQVAQESVSDGYVLLQNQVGVGSDVPETTRA